MSRVAISSAGAAVVHEKSLAVHDGTGARIAEHKLAKPGDAVARFGDEWLVSSEKQKQLARVGDGAAQPFGAGKAAITAFTVGGDDAVAIARGETIESWSRDGERRWAKKAASPALRLTLARDHVVVLGEDGALCFLAREDGEALGALRLASVEPPADWRLAHVDANVVVLGLGDWLVWIDASTRKTIRRVRARAKVRAVAADASHVVAGVEEGFVQAFRAPTGEPRASVACEGEPSAIGLGPDTLFVVASRGELRAFERAALDATTRAASPIACVTARGSLVAAGEKAGRVRVLAAEHGDLRELGAVTGAEGAIALALTKDDGLVVAGQRLLLRIAPGAWREAGAPPRPFALGTPPTAFAVDDAYAFVGSQAGAVDVYELASGRAVTTYKLSPDDRITALVRLTGARLVVGTGALDGRVLVVDVADAKVVHRLSPHEEAFGVTCLAADPRGRIVASGSDEGTVALIDPAKGRVLAKIRVTETPVSLAFEPSGRRFACIFADGTAAIVTLAQKGATVADLGVRGATQVAWADGLVLGFKDGRVESGDRHARPSDRPSATGE